MNRAVCCPRCRQPLQRLNFRQGPDDQWAHGVYYGADFGFWCVFRATPELARKLRRIDRGLPPDPPKRKAKAAEDFRRPVRKFAR